jgi:hypothetical protein
MLCHPFMHLLAIMANKLDDNGFAGVLSNGLESDTLWVELEWCNVGEVHNTFCSIVLE